MPPSYLDVQAEIQADPDRPDADRVGYFNEQGNRRRSAEILALLSTPDPRWTRRDPIVSIDRIKTFCYERGLDVTWDLAMSGANLPLRTLAATAMRFVFLSPPPDASFDNPRFWAKIDTLVAAGLFDTREDTGLVTNTGPTNKADLAKLALVPVSRAVFLWGDNPDIDTVERAR